MKPGWLAAWLLAPGLVLQLGSLDAIPAKARQYIDYAPEQQTIAAGKRAVLELRFRVKPGFHINSHLPKSELLIATNVELMPAGGVQVATAQYPPGHSLRFPFDPSEELDVYAEDFTVKLPVTASAGEHELHGTLNYQACNQAACYPPRALPISILFDAK